MVALAVRLLLVIWSSRTFFCDAECSSSAYYSDDYDPDWRENHRCRRRNSASDCCSSFGGYYDNRKECCGGSCCWRPPQSWEDIIQPLWTTTSYAPFAGFASGDTTEYNPSAPPPTDAIFIVVGLFGMFCLCSSYFAKLASRGQPLEGDRSAAASLKEEAEPIPDAEKYCPAYCHNQTPDGDFDDRADQEHLVEVAQRMLDETWKDRATRDRTGKVPKGVEVVSVQRFEDSRMWRDYLSAKHRIRKRGHILSIPELDGDPTRGSVMTDKYVGQFTNHESIDRSVNEHFLLHGTSPDAAENIAENGFRLNLAGSNKGTMFGKGAYFAEQSSKADEYAVAGSGAGTVLGFRGFEQQDDEYAFLFCRVACGDMYYALRSSEKEKFLPMLRDGDIDGVLGDRQAAVGSYREFVVFQRANISPEFRILYRRVYDEEADEEALE